jgi:hypothetical protein
MESSYEVEMQTPNSGATQCFADDSLLLDPETLRLTRSTVWNCRRVESIADSLVNRRQGTSSKVVQAALPPNTVVTQVTAKS